MADPAAPAYERLAALIERQLQLAGERRLDELEAVARAAARLQESLPATPPAAARPSLERCARLHRRLEIELLRVREALLLELAQLHRAQRAADGYAPARRNGRRVVAAA